MLTRVSLGLIFDELNKSDCVVAVFTGLVPSRPIGIVNMRWFEDRLMFLVDIGCRNSWVCDVAAKAGSLECLDYARRSGCRWDKWTSASAARAGSLECLKYAHTHDCPWDSYVCIQSVRAKSLPCLEYAHTHGCPWDEWTCVHAVMNESLECLKYAHEHGCPWNEWCFRVASGVCLEYLTSNGYPQ